MMRRTLIALALVTLVPLASGCDDETPAATGDLVLTYQIGGGTSTCEDVNIDNVHVYIRSGTTTITDDIFPCDPDDQTVRFDDVPVGTYSIVAEGLNSDSSIIYTGELEEPFTIVANTTNQPSNPLRLLQIPPSLQIFFDFADAGNCEFFGVVEIRVVLYTVSGSLEFDEVYDCAAQLTSSILIEDLNEGTEYELRVRGANDNGEFLYQYNQTPITVAPGAPTVIEAELAACPTMCDAP